MRMAGGASASSFFQLDGWPKAAGSRRPCGVRTRPVVCCRSVAPVAPGLCARQPRRPAIRQPSRISAGHSNGGCGQSSSTRAAAISSSPRAAPWVPDVPCLLGAPKPMIVLQAISDGLSESARASMALRSLPGRGRRPRSCPSRRPRTASADRRFRTCSAAVDGDVVVVKQHDQLGQPR